MEGRMLLSDAIAELRRLQADIDPEASFKQEDLYVAIDMVLEELFLLRKQETKGESCLE